MTKDFNHFAEHPQAETLNLLHRYFPDAPLGLADIREALEYSVLREWQVKVESGQHVAVINVEALYGADLSYYRILPRDEQVLASHGLDQYALNWHTGLVAQPLGKRGFAAEPVVIYRHWIVRVLSEAEMLHLRNLDYPADYSTFVESLLDLCGTLRYNEGVLDERGRSLKAAI